MSDESFAFGMLIALIVGIAIGCFIGYFQCENAAGIKECEANLPRNQHCILIAVPENKAEGEK